MSLIALGLPLSCRKLQAACKFKTIIRLDRYYQTLKALNCYITVEGLCENNHHQTSYENQ